MLPTAYLPSEQETAAALLDNLPTRLGLPNDSSHWTDTELDKTLAYLENACQQLRQFSNKFKAQMAWQVGQCFGLTNPPRNWDDALKAAQNWRNQSVDALRYTGLVGNPDARDLLYVLDAPHSFEQAFLNALASRWGLLPFEQWQTISIRDQYLQRLEQAKAAAEVKAAELSLSSPQTTTADPANPATDNVTVTTGSLTSPNGTAAPITNSPTATTAPATATTRITTTKASSKTAKYNAHLNSKQVSATNTVSGQVQSNGNSSVVEQALTEVKALFEGLSPQERDALWQRLKEEYDPQ